MHEAIPPMKPALYLGLMSGTSLDGADAVLADFAAAIPRIIGHAYATFPPALRAELLALQSVGPNELHRAAMAANALADHYARIVKEVLLQSGVPGDAVIAIGAHGQTVRHRPDAGYTLQLNAPARLAEATGIDVVADFRSRDVAADGQGAPLAPAFHAAVFGHPARYRGVLNIGGIANVTALPPGHDDPSAVRGWDCGPGNVFLDSWAARHGHGPFDRDGQWASTGHVLTPLLATLLEEPWLAYPPPKSTGRDLFGDAWLEACIEPSGARAEDIQATLAEFSAIAVATSVAQHVPLMEEMIVCGGGARNTDLLGRLDRCLGVKLGRRIPVIDSNAVGIAADHVEALAFAWLARRCLLKEPGNLPSVTGARGCRILGAIYPGSPNNLPQTH